MTDICVVVPTRDRPGPLDRCLRALADQATAAVDVVVVDDASSDAAAVAAVVAAHPGVRLLRAEGRGPAAARNLGARSAQSPLVAFTDDDCAPDPVWAATLLQRFEAGATVVAGPTVNGRGRDPFAAASQTITNHLVAVGLAAGTVTFAPTSNLAVAADVHAAVPFDEDFPLAAGEDRDYCDRLRAAGYDIAYDAAALVVHFQDLGPRGFWRQQYRYGRGAVHWRRRGADRGRQPVSFYAGLLAAAVSQGPAVGALVVAAQVATAAGMWSASRAS